MDAELRKNIESTCRAAKEFTDLYYKCLDKQRNAMKGLYLDAGVLVWNGNGVNGHDNIQKYIIDLPSSEHILSLLDAQPLIDVGSGQKTILVQAGGSVKFTNQQTKQFQQTFVLTAQDNKWKIVSDCYRLQDSLQSDRKN